MQAPNGSCTPGILTVESEASPAWWRAGLPLINPLVNPLAPAIDATERSGCCTLPQLPRLPIGQLSKRQIACIVNDAVEPCKTPPAQIDEISLQYKPKFRAAIGNGPVT